MKIKKPSFAGRFYPSQSKEIKSLIDNIVLSEKNKIDLSFTDKQLLGGIAPHAGYIYSGYHAVHLYEILKHNKEQFDTFVIINPNHTGMGSGNFNLCSASHWETPLGKIETDKIFSEKLYIETNDQAHYNEHSGEIQLPILQHFIPYPFKIVVITMNIQSPNNAEELAQKLINVAHTTEKKIFVLASSDFSHYDPPEEGYRKDQFVIDNILNLKTTEIYKQVKKHHITICGYGPIMTLVAYSKLAAKAPKIQVLRRGHSGETYKSDEVVDYVSLLSYA